MTYPTIDTTAVTHAQLRNLVEALEVAVVSRSDLGDFADAIEKALPGLILKSAPLVPRCEPVPFRMTVIRGPDNLITEIIARPEPDL